MNGPEGMFLSGEGIDLSPYVDAFVKGLLQGVLLAWPVWVALGMLIVGAVALGIFRRLLRVRSGPGDIDRMRAWKKAAFDAPPARGQAARTSLTERGKTTVAAQGQEDANRCAVCGERVSERVREYCSAHATRFGGRVLCFRHQRGS